MVGIWVVTHAVNLIGSKPANLEALLILGFIVGVFPATIWEFVTKASRKIGAFVIKLPNIESRFPLSELDGLTVWHQARLEEEDIENIPNVATADIIGLVLSTRIPPQRIIDWVDQSILVFNLGQADATNNNQTFLEKLREHGIRTASALLVSYDNVIDSPNFGENEKSKVKTLCDTFLTSSNILLVLTWRGMAQHSMSPADTSP
ncbi:MAG: hypothetical protein GWM87_06705 [Xanthomonadales bacterium]|nr:hypothetical protein [Xanthomonadales bacterium]NIX12655.1 hypothetical protein [Xanthomonadales bacterium]